jgi:uncharacterized protein
MNSAEKLENLKSIIRKTEKIAVAFSGGTDSTFLLKVAKDILGKDKVLAVTVISPIRFEDEIKKSTQIAKDLGIRQIIVDSNELEDENFAKNDALRCYYCKYSIFKDLIKIAKENGVKFVADGTNYDDFLNDYRPGLKALTELGISSPLKDAELTKSEIRNFSKEMGLPTWDKQPETCLATRFPYGTRITTDKLEKIRKIEFYLSSTGLKVHRARYHDEKTLRIEVMPAEFQIIIEKKFEIVKLAKSLGFNYVTLDLEGYRSGSLNEVLKNGR